ncbi:sulfite reductase [Polychytrium aggregatum]|uniref:sulfite reductase n=1 Tax=Polychytrium aggregatum TaxID=110093 RepID=UPI0022FF07CC|nr:sulfite reductase [Polychytrium aggregatum]KAI9207491.1 sulfite reductase [Polychytrium aggregatum]
MASSKQSFDAKTAISYIGYDLADVNIFVGNQAVAGDLIPQWAESKAKNAFGHPGTSKTVYNPKADLYSTVAAATAQRQLISAYTPSSELISAIPTLSKLLADRSPAVVHTALLNRYGDSSDVMAVRQTGVSILASNSVQEAQDIALASHIAALRTQIPAIHVFNGLNTTTDIHSVQFSDLKHLSTTQLQHVNAYKQHSEPAAEPKLYAAPLANIDYADAIASIDSVFTELRTALPGRKYSLFEYSGASDATSVIVLIGSAPSSVEDHIHHLAQSGHKVGVVRVRVYRPWSDAHFIAALPKTTKRIAVVELAQHLATNWGPLFLDVASAFQSDSWTAEPPAIREARVHLGESKQLQGSNIDYILRELQKDEHGVIAVEGAVVRGVPPLDSVALSAELDLDVEQPYLKMLHQLFGDRLSIANVSEQNSAAPTQSPTASAEYGLGLHIAQIQQRSRFVDQVSSLANGKAGAISSKLADALKNWLQSRDNADQAKEHADAAIALLAAETNPVAKEVLAQKDQFAKPARWIVGGDLLWYDIGSSGVHHVISSKENVNMILLDTQPYSEKAQENQDRRKKDIGLYAMTYGGVYVASVSVYASYAQVLRALAEAEAYPGPSVVLAYAPRITVPNYQRSTISKPLAILKESKLAIDSGYWPLYRWNPALKEPFALDSAKVKAELHSFLERENHLALVLDSEPQIAPEFAATVERELRGVMEAKIQESYKLMLGSLNSKPVLVLYGSDGGNAEKLAKKLSSEAKQRGLRSRVAVMDALAVDDLQKEENIVFVVSTAGQGEFPSNAKELWKSIAAATPDEANIGAVNFSVFSMGDRHYWPLPEDAHYFAKAGKDLYAKLLGLGGQPLTPVGLGDDQDPDGYFTGYNQWVAELWKSLGVDNIEVSASAAPSADDFKEASNYLRGTIAEGLVDTSTGALSEPDTLLTKFHGIYQQDDRDLRDERARQGLEKAFSFMIRVRVPGGVATPAQWLAMDTIAGTHANDTIKITTRQAFQFHGVIKKNLKQTIQDINHALMDTIAACGDVNRNVMCNPNPLQSQVHHDVYEFSKTLSAYFTPNTSAYHEIWLDKKLVATSEDAEPIYGKTYLPRKFKIAIAVPPSNDVDVLAHDLGFIAIIENDKLIGFNITVGGGMGMTHGNKKTYPNLARPLCFAPLSEALDIGEKVLTVQRDHGDRTNRKHARLKYTIDDRGLDWFRSQIEERVGYKLQAPKPYNFTSNGDVYGWTRNANGRWNYTLYVENGRVKDTPDLRMRTALREIAKIHRGDFRLTPNQHLVIANIPESDKALIAALLKDYKIENGNLSGMMMNSMACVALPTCGLAMAESERYLPELVTKIEKILEENGLRDDAITVRMTGCPNGCARPAIAELGFIGKAPGVYNMYLGGGFAGERLSKIYKESLNEEEILCELRPIVKRYALERRTGEHFGDFVIRAGIVKATRNGMDFHD